MLVNETPLQEPIQPPNQLPIQAPIQPQAKHPMKSAIQTKITKKLSVVWKKNIYYFALNKSSKSTNDFSF